jgi:iron complex outermembrane recepter protein
MPSGSCSSLRSRLGPKRFAGVRTWAVGKAAKVIVCARRKNEAPAFETMHDYRRRNGNTAIVDPRVIGAKSLVRVTVYSEGNALAWRGKMVRIAILLLAVGIAIPLFAQTPAAQTPAMQAPTTEASAKTFAQQLVDETLASRPELLDVEMHATPPGSSESVFIASKRPERVGMKSRPHDIAVFRTGTALVEVNAAGDQNVEVQLPLLDVRGRAVGSVEVKFPYPPGSGLDTDLLQKKAERIRDELSRRISNLDSLFAPAEVEPTQPKLVGRAPTIEEEGSKEALGNRQSLPMTKAVVSGKALEESSQEGYAEAVRNVAGVAPANSKGSPNDSIYIRGIKLNLFSNYRLNGGLPTAGVITTPNEDKERVETLKGANALMFGVASPAGIINLVTKRATDHDVATFGVAGNAFGQYGVNADLGKRFGPEKQFGIRVNLSDTHLENGVRHMGGHGDFESVGLDWKVTDRLSFQGDLENYSKRVPEQAGISLLPAVNGVVPITPVPNPRNLLSGTWSLYAPKTENMQGRVDYIIADGWKVLAEIGRSYAERSRFTVRIGGYDLVTGAGGVVTVQPVTNKYVNKFERAEVLGKFSTWFLTHDLTVGASESERDANTSGQNNVILPQRQNIFDPIVLDPPVFTRPFTSLPLQTSKDTGVYAYDTIGVTPQWKLLLGLRQTKDKEDNGVKQTSTTVQTPAYGVLYDIRPTTTLFASYMEGLEAGGTAPANAANANVILPSAISRQKEIGIRDSYFKGLSISGSFFQIVRANAVTDPISNLFENNGNLAYKGVESTMSYEINRQWTVNGAIQWLTAVQNSPLQPLINGKVPENTPKWLANLSVTYRVLQVPGLTLTAGTSDVSKRFVNPQDQGVIPGYALYTAGAGYVTRIGGRRVALQLNVDNVANRRYWNSVQTGTYGTGMDRSVKMSAKVDF